MSNENEVEVPEKVKYSIIIINHECLKHTIACIESLFKHTKNFELIIVDNDSKDGSRGYLSAFAEMKSNVKLVFTNRRYNFSENNNFGLDISDKQSDYIIFLNNDTIVTPDWLERMEAHFSNIPFENIGAVGPVSCNSNGRQMVDRQDSEQWYAQHRGKWAHTGVLFGWCMMFKRSVIEEIGGFDERFENSHEDNDLCLRTQLAGYKLFIAYDTYIHHEGQATLRKHLNMKEYGAKGYENREKYYDKWYKETPKKLVAVYRTNWGKHLEASLEQTSKFADSIILHFIRLDGSKDRDEDIDKLLEKFPKIKMVGFYDGVFQEDYERNWLLQKALELQAKGEADWCLSVDDDEIYEDKFITKVKRMINPRNPETFAYWCQWRTIWREELGKEYYRIDSTFGRFSNFRLFRLIKNQEIKSMNHPEGHHCGSAPMFANENLQWSNIRVKHLGYDTPEQRQKKYEFYEANDHFKKKEDIGQEDYSHLISKNPQVEVYDKDNSISLLIMVKNEEDHILGLLENVHTLVDEYVIVDTGSTDSTLDIIRHFAKYAMVPVKILNYAWDDNYSRPRNFGKRFCSGKWILMMDADERFNPEDIKAVFNLTETEEDFILFHVINYMEEKRPGVEQKYASTEAVRLYRNIPEFYYTGIIHETIDDAMVSLSKGRKLFGKKSPVLLHHYGYLKSNKKVRHKFDYYEILNKKQIEVTGGLDSRPYFNLALHWINDDKPEKALEAFQKALEIDPNMWHASQQMAALNMKNAKHFLAQVINTIPGRHPFRDQAIRMLEYLNANTFGTIKVV